MRIDRSGRSTFRSEPIPLNPRLHPLVHRKLPLGISRVLGVQLVGVDFEGNPFVAAAARESGDISGGKIGGAVRNQPQGLKPAF